MALRTSAGSSAPSQSPSQIASFQTVLQSAVWQTVVMQRHCDVVRPLDLRTVETVLKQSLLIPWVVMVELSLH